MNARPHTPYIYLTQAQLIDMLEMAKSKLNKWKLHNLNLMCKVGRLTVKMNAQKALVIAISQCDLHRVNAILKVVLKQCCSPTEIVRRIERVVEDTYHAHGWADTDHHLALLMYQLAGRKGLYMCSKAIGLPSHRTIMPHYTPVDLIPLMSSVKAWEIAANIKGLPVLVSEAPLCGYGILIDGFHINNMSVVMNHQLLTKELACLPRHNSKMVELLLDPNDHQNVPKAVQLLQAIQVLSKVEHPSPSPTDMDTQFVHLLFALFRGHSTGFMTGQLYSDIETMIKSTYFGVARQQLLDGDKPYYLCQERSNQLEVNFGQVRTTTHDSDCDALELREQLCSVADIVNILNPHSEWDRG
ncbi:hypothetical protein K466DRAFT_606019 [Polyporus arcularius HHB13444]|uniref:Uncharacterized protein n=1 Tax=Polyporus arcularius HHB13444 TaxID=1314778 RepID=A0A5C3NQK5_9APHY|nr:hypothetical protein K466DRAFT_606019 [Polyporus arcularius HHB13444]